ncbi:MAG TPA: hypothetical protein PLP22_06510 [Candidatus Competibacter sp.]|nr:hypothetical protein [Candidatus Competibacteraceae bacterium]HRE54426.1 hypothetical protein [Candidatus Competibacter sp.]HUM94270.1 hypothetical protein [Candidatus Competibacter sp.]
MWQDALALLIVAIAAGFLLRRYAPDGLLRFGPPRIGHGPDAPATLAAGACPDCALAGSCAKTRPPA